MKKMIVLSVVFLVAVGCGKKAPPVPWESIVPKRIVDLSGVSREGGLLLDWTVPKENTDKSALTDLTFFHILRSEGEFLAGECKGCGENPRIVREIKLGGKEQIKGKKMSVPFEDLQPRRVYVFQVVSVNGRGHPSAPSNPVQVVWDDLPGQPGGLKGEGGHNKVELLWEPVTGAAGYNVYRRARGEAVPSHPVNRNPLTETRYTDLSVENEKIYAYTIRAVKQVVKNEVEGKGSAEVLVTPTDRLPPAPPAGLVAIPLKNGIELNWRRNREPDLLGYHVYRRKRGEGEFRKLTRDPIPKEIFLDSGTEPGEDYDYAVSAVDLSPHRNESLLSEEVRVKNIY